MGCEIQYDVTGRDLQLNRKFVYQPVLIYNRIDIKSSSISKIHSFYFRYNVDWLMQK